VTASPFALAAALAASLASAGPVAAPNSPAPALIEPTPLPTATPAAVPSPAPVPPAPAASATAGETASPAPTPVPTATPNPYGYRFVPHLPTNVDPGQPVIYAVYLNSSHLHSNGPILIKVATNENVVRVVSRSNGREGSVPRVAEGTFEAQSRLPKIPFIAAGITVDLEFIAWGADGRHTSVRVPVRLD
jgi:hypothetical protein